MDNIALYVTFVDAKTADGKVYEDERINYSGRSGLLISRISTKNPELFQALFYTYDNDGNIVNITTSSGDILDKEDFIFVKTKHSVYGFSKDYNLNEEQEKELFDYYEKVKTSEEFSKKRQSENIQEYKETKEVLKENNRKNKKETFKDNKNKQKNEKMTSYQQIEKSIDDAASEENKLNKLDKKQVELEQKEKQLENLNKNDEKPKEEQTEKFSSKEETIEKENEIPDINETENEEGDFDMLLDFLDEDAEF